MYKFYCLHTDIRGKIVLEIVLAPNKSEAYTLVERDNTFVTILNETELVLVASHLYENSGEYDINRVEDNDE